MKLSKRLLTAFALVALSVSASVIPAQAAGSTLIWSTSSSSRWVGAVDSPKVAVSGNVQAVAWISRTGVDTHNLSVRVSRDGAWGPVENIANSEWDWWNAFDVQITSTGTVYVGYSSGDVTLTVYTSSVAGVWTNAVVDSSYSGSGAVKMSGVTDGSIVSFTTNRGASRRAVTVLSYSFDEAHASDGWTTKSVEDFTTADFSTCAVHTSVYYDSCSVLIGEPRIGIAADGSQIIFVDGQRISTNGNSAGTQFRLFKFHRPTPTADWVRQSVNATMTLGRSDNSYAYFLSHIATSPSGKFAAALVTGNTHSNNRVRLFSGASFASAVTEPDSVAIAKFRNTELPTLVSLGDEIYTSFDANQGTHKFGKVGSLASTIRNMSVAKSNQDVKNLLVVGGKVLAVIQTPKSATYVSSCTLTNGVCSWTSASKILGYAQTNTFTDGAAATDGEHYITVQPKLSGTRTVRLYSFTN